MTKKESGMRRNEFKTTSTAAEGARMAGKSGRSRRGLKAFLPILIVLVAALAFASGAVALTDGAGAPPSVYSDQADYAPGSTVTLTGTGWQPDEVIHLFVNDNVGNTWSWSADLTADGSGNFTASLTLSSGFVASYGVTATGSLGGSASTSFTDASLGSLVGPSSPTTSTNASFTWSVSGSGGSLQPVCSLDSSSGPWVNCSSPKSYTGLSTGSHTFYVKLSDKMDSTAASWPWTINPSDATPPYVVSISRAAPTPTNATSVSWTVTFSESVSGVDSTDFALASAVSAASITDVTGTGSSRTVTAGTGTGDGTLGLNLVDDNSIVDGASNVLGTSSGAGDGGSTGQVYSIDKTKPLISAFANNADTTSYIAGTWTNQSVTVSFTCSDGTGSGISSNTLTGGGVSTETSAGSVTNGGACTDNAGNSANAVTFSPIKIDTTAPTINCGTADGSWHAVNVSIACTASDGGGSGLASAEDGSFSLSTNVLDGSETNNAATGSRDVYDVAGNKATAGPITGNEVDKKAPSITNDGVQSGTAGSNGWYVSAVGNGFSASDGGSGLSASCNTAFPKNVSTGTDEGSAVTVGSGACTDAVGNSNAGISSAAFKIDLHSPTVSCGSADMAWHADNVSIACTASDGGSGLVPDSGDASFNLSTSVGPDSETSNASTGTRDVTDVAGRTTQAGPIGGNKIDRKAPQLSGCDTADGNWHAADVTLHCTYTDGGSGPASQTVSLTTAVNAGVETADAAASAGGVQACDDLNNCASSPADIGGNKIDRKAPVISCGSADSVWHGADQSVTCSASDDGSGLAVSGDSSFTLSTNVAANTDTTSAMTGTHLVADGVGNSDTAGPVGPFKIDKKAPTYTCDTAPTAWSGSDITINCTAADSGSGLNPVTDASFSLSTNVTPGTETSDASTGTKTLTDAVGHATTAGPITGLNVDKKNPTITFLSKTMPNTSGWNNASVTVNWTCSDGGSGIVSNSDSKTLATEGANKSATGTCTDNVGHTSSDTQTGINIDETAPTVAYTSAPAPNGAGWYKTNVVATFTATDTLSGFAGPSTTKTDTSTTSGEGSAVTVGSPAFTDLAGNTAVAGTKTSDPFKIDKTPPTVSVTSVSNLAPYTLGAVPVAGCSTTDPGGSGVATSATASVTGGTGNGVGTFTATCSGAVDTAGNNQAAPVSVTYTVNYGGLGGILQPINPDNTSVFSRGKAVPVKFQLGGDQPNGFNSSGWKLQQQPVNCAIVTDVGTVVEAVVDNPSNGFRYDSTADQYIYNANFKDQAVGTCWKVVVTLDSGQMLYSAVFKLQK
jgi:hypothetical protein